MLFRDKCIAGLRIPIKLGVVPYCIGLCIVRTQKHSDRPVIRMYFCSYQYGPDTYLLQLRDVDFPVRLREYMKVAKKTNSEGMDWQVSKHQKFQN